MDFDYEKAEQEFKDELETGKFKLTRIPNNGADYKEKEKRDLAVFTDYLQTDSFKTLNDEASK